MTRLPRLARGLLLFAAMIPAGLALAACGDDDDGATSTTAPTTASATAVTERTPSPITGTAVPATPGSTPSATATAGARRTGNAAIDSVLAAIESRDAAKLAALGAFVETGCTSAPGLGGPPKCTTGQAPGTVVRVFPVAGCEGGYIEPAQLQSTLTREVTSQNPHVYAVTVARQSANPEPYFPMGDFSVFLDVKGATTHGVMLSLNQSGQIVNLWTGCAGSAAEVYGSRKAEPVLLAPLQMGG